MSLRSKEAFKFLSNVQTLNEAGPLECPSSISGAPGSGHSSDPHWLTAMRRVLAASCMRAASARILEGDAVVSAASSCGLQQSAASCSPCIVRQTAAALISHTLCGNGARSFAAAAGDEGDDDPEIRNRASPQVCETH